MELVDGQSPDGLAKLYDEFLSGSDLNDGIDDLGVVMHTVVLIMSMEKFVYGVAPVLGKSSPYSGTAVLAGYVLQYLHQSVDGCGAPAVEILHRSFLSGDFMGCIVYKRCEFFSFLLGKELVESLVDPSLYRTGAGLQHVLEGLKFSVDIREEILSSFRQS